ncbi:cellular tumor antigen p53-like isoform X2 [Armigeres subalbatus]|uniref:cellular tumor antigen p53-like isoform X2 n=1 Tax=Armigeres subalbatus TaxID=124917 RepID=UPI002ED3F96F
MISPDGCSTCSTASESQNNCYVTVRKNFEMVDSQDMTVQTYEHQDPAQPVEECDAAQLVQIPTNELMMDLDGVTLFDYPEYETLKFEAIGSLLEESCDQDMESKPTIDQKVMAVAALLDHMDRTPTLDEVENPVYNFNVDLNGETSGKSSWMFSSRLNKVFVKMGQACTFNISYQTLAHQELYIRAMMVCSAPEDMHQPVYRCENHRVSDNTNPKLADEVKTHVMRCFNPSTRYVGTENGVAFKDRLAVIIPLGLTTQEQVALNVSLEFVCQNSCRIINRRATAIIFTLEDSQGQILGKKSLHLKVCSCPKRDKQKEEESLAPAKRKSDTHLQAPPGKKVAKVATLSRHPGQQLPRLTPSPPLGKLAFIKKELSSETLSCGQKARAIAQANSQEMVEGTGIPVTVHLPTVELAAKVAEYAFQVVATELVRNSTTEPEGSKKLAAFLTSIRRVQTRKFRRVKTAK